DEQDLAADVVDADLTQRARHLERKGKRAVEVLVEAVVAAGRVAEQEGRRPRLPVCRTAREIAAEVRWKALARAERLHPAIGHRREAAIQRRAEGRDRLRK